MKIFVLVALFFGSLLASDAMLEASKYEYVSQSIGKGKPYFLEVGAKSCKSCQIMGKSLYQIKQMHSGYNIHFIDVSKEREAAYELNVRMIPTQIIFDKNGQEVYRNIGVLSNEQLNGLFKEHKFDE